MVPEIRNELLSILAYLQKKRSVVASQEDLLQVIRVVQYLLAEEAINMSMSDNAPFEKGYEVGSVFAALFEVKEDALALQNFGWLMAPVFGYDHTSTVKPFLMGLAKGVKDASPKLISDGKQE